MERKTYLSIIATAVLTLTGCSGYHESQTIDKIRTGPLGLTSSTLSLTEDGLASNTNEPSELIQAFTHTGRTWFDTDKAELREQGKSELDGLVSKLMHAKSKGLISETNKLVIIGHTDSRASEKYNQNLSERRAKSVAVYLKAKGIPTSAMVAVGKGEIQPVASNSNPTDRQKNRRVEFHIEGDGIRVVTN